MNNRYLAKGNVAVSQKEPTYQWLLHIFEVNKYSVGPALFFMDLWFFFVWQPPLFVASVIEWQLHLHKRDELNC